MKRRSSAGPDGRLEGNTVPIKASLNEMKQQLRLGPANRAAKPLSNTRNVFKIKQGLTEAQPTVGTSRMPPRSVSAMPMGTETTPLLGGFGRNGSAIEDGNDADGARKPDREERDR